MSDSIGQHTAWASGQAADAYFARNREKLDAARPVTRSTRFLASAVRRGSRLLEIGAANGRTLEQIRQLTPCETHGLDPSPAAVADGHARYPDVHLRVGTADALPYADEYFDAVLLGFCLYLVDRRLLFRVVAEADRVLNAGTGRLMITDFDPPFSYRRAFDHQPGLWSYKMPHVQLWLANPNYALVEKVAFSHRSDGFNDDPDERVASWVLQKLPVDTAYPLLPR